MASRLKFFMRALGVVADIVRLRIAAVIMAVDWGARRIGIATSASGAIATPHSVIANDGDAVAAVAALAQQLEAQTIVLGLPRRAGSTSGEAKFRELAERLRQKSCKA